MQRAAVHKAIWVVKQFLVVALGVVVYFGVRGLTQGDPAVARAHAARVVHVETELGLNGEHRIQAVLHGRDWLTDVANWIYIWGHWPVIAVVLVWLALRHRDVFARLRNAMMISGAIGLVIYATYPVAPPRLAGLGLIDTVTQRSDAYRVLQPPAFVNQYAALPSLHVGWDLLVGLSVAAAASSLLLRLIGLAMPLLMAGAVVLTANHYIVDGLAGAALALAGLGLAYLIERRKRRAATAVRVPAPRGASRHESLDDAWAR